MNLRTYWSYAHTAFDGFYMSAYDSANNVYQTTNCYFNSYPNYNVNRVDNYTYGQHGNVQTHSVLGYTGTDTAANYNASQYFQKASAQDINGHNSTFGVGDNQGNDPNDGTIANSVGNKGNVLWVKDAKYGDGLLTETGTRYSYTYNSYGQKANETNQNGVITTYTYGDAWGNLTQVIQDPHVVVGDAHLARTTIMAYDICGHVLQSTDPAGQISIFSYNNLGQPISASFPAKGTAPAETISYTYGANGRTDTVTDNRGGTSIAYEAGRERVKSVTDPVTGSVSYTYGLIGERLTMTIPAGGTWTYGYAPPTSTFGVTWQSLPKDDPNSIGKLLQTITDDQGRRVDYNIDYAGHMIWSKTNQVYTIGGSPSLVSFCESDYTYDNYLKSNGHDQYIRGYLNEIKNTFHTVSPVTTTVLAQNDYTYDNAGQRLTNLVTDNLGTTRTEIYTYDQVNRLSTVNYGDGQTQSYAFDAMGNRTSKTDTGGGINGTEGYTYNNANMLLTRGGNNYTNDADGNTLTGGGRTNTWDSENRLVSCAYGGNTTTNIYGSDGIRHRSTVNGITTDYALDNSMMIRELRAGSAYATYLQGARGPEYRRDNGSPTTAVVRWYVYDGLGSVVAEVDPSGNVTSSRKYDAYGLVRGGVNPGGTSKQKYVGSLGHTSDDESGLVYMRARYMDPQVGRFVTQDPALHGENWLIYCSNNTINFIDKTGKTSGNLNEEMEADADAADSEGEGGGGAIQTERYLTNKINRIFDIIKRETGMSRQEFRVFIHQLKDQMGIGAKENIIFNQSTGELFRVTGEGLESLGNFMDWL